METFAIRNLAFSYPECPEKALDGVDLTVYPGEFLVLCGPSGCGKSTLLRQLKPTLTPHGVRSGELLFEGTPLGQLDHRTESTKIGFVQQSPENQIVTDKVWHELAFGLESLGCDTPTIRRRVAEMASFFGIQTWFYKNVTELSGGQKQLLNLASVMAMQPSVLILDEPTSQLDPIAAADFLALLGGNGTGKTTSLKLLAGLLKPYRGEVHIGGSVGMLPQNPQTLFVKKTVREDLLEILRETKLTKAQKEEKTAHVVTLCRLEPLLDRHPYDLSGGEQQRAALAKALLLDPEILLMDEPTKGLDAEFKAVFAEILQVLLHRGTTVLMVSHDVEFCARYAHRCAMFFDGSIVTSAPPRAFFSGNSFYTTSANRMSRGLVPGAVTPEDVIAVCGGSLPTEQPLPEDAPLPAPTESSADWRPAPLPWWRKGIAAVSLAAAVGVFVKAVAGTDLTQLVSSTGLSVLAAGQMKLYLLCIAALVLFAAAIGRRSRPPLQVQTPKEQRRLTKRTVFACTMILLLIPVTLFVGLVYLENRKYYFIMLLVLLECMLPFFLIFEGRKPQARELVVIAVLVAIGVAGRSLFFMLPEFKPVVAITIIAGVAFGGESVFLVGAMTMLVSNIMFGQGPWTPWQMFALGVIGFLAGVLFRKGLLRRSRESMAIFGALCAILIYGGIMNPASALLWAQEINWKVILTYYLSGFPVDCVHAAATFIFLWFAAEPMLEKLDRIKVKYGLVER